MRGWSGGHAGEIAGEPQLARGGLGRAGGLHGRGKKSGAVACMEEKALSRGHAAGW